MASLSANTPVRQLLGHSTLRALDEVLGVALGVIRGEEHDPPMAILPSLLEHLVQAVHR